jgi:hypothetical protein
MTSARRRRRARTPAHTPAGDARRHCDSPPAPRSAGLAVAQRIHVLMLERRQELIDLLLTETALTTGRTVRLEVAHVRPTPDRPERHSECLSGLRSRQTKRASVDIPHSSISACFGRNERIVQQLHSIRQETRRFRGNSGVLLDRISGYRSPGSRAMWNSRHTAGECEHNRAIARQSSIGREDLDQRASIG